jgi:hypothetical protein
VSRLGLDVPDKTLQFDEDIVDEAAFAVHADLHALLDERVRKVRRCELCSLVRVEYPGLAKTRQGLVKRVHAEARIHRI